MNNTPQPEDILCWLCAITIAVWLMVGNAVSLLAGSYGHML